MHLTGDDLVQIHDRLISLHGGTRGILDQGTIEYVVTRASGRDSFVEEAAVLIELIAMMHPFLDGNKRTAFASAETLLRINGSELVVGDKEAIEFMLEIASGDMTHTQVLAWLEDRLKNLDEPLG